ncbi:hypothetical protein K0M31_011540 [Melipona bicolor]|uniref:Uncharacterized protein n=1 Tax=Melipona bicolor TaxID=60889 RepID=A0AA40KV48_9HYME|nr:hypothetical protein K0M31_011540 [Melipona bicolor]
MRLRTTLRPTIDCASKGGETRIGRREGRKGKSGIVKEGTQHPSPRQAVPNKGTEGKRDGLPALQPDEEQRGKGVGREWREDGRRRQRDEERGKVHAMRKGGEEERKGRSVSWCRA